MAGGLTFPLKTLQVGLTRQSRLMFYAQVVPGCRVILPVKLIVNLGYRLPTSKGEPACYGNPPCKQAF